MRLLGISFSIFAAAMASSAALAADPAARIQPVTSSLYGDRIVDNYRWMEKVDPEFVTWAKAEDARTRSELQSLPGYPALLAAMTKSVEAQVAVGAPTRVGDALFYRKRGVGEAQFSLFSRPVAGGPERRLVDPVKLKGATTALSDWAVSPDGRWLAYGLADGGSEETTLYLYNLKAGRALPESIDRARFASPNWSADGSVVFYNRLKPGGVGAERFTDAAVFMHRPGSDPAADAKVFSAAMVGSALGHVGFVFASTTPGSPYVVGVVNSGVSQESELYVAHTQALQAGRPDWKRFATMEDKVEGIAVAASGSQAWVTTFRDTPRRKLLRIDLDHPDMAHAAVVTPERAGVLKQVGVARDGLYAVYAEGGAYTLDKVAPDGALTPVAAPFKGSIYGLNTDPRYDGAYVTLESGVHPRDVYETSGGALRSMQLAPGYPIDLSAFTEETVYATAKDGTKIPIDLIHRKDLKRDGSNITLVDAYGAYGVSVDPDFRPDAVAMLQQGVILAEAHVRGGGEFGESWHLAGKQATKPNTWRDFIASVEALERMGYTSPGKVAGMGVSAGGVMIGRTVTERPDLLAAAVMWAPMINTLRFETTEGGPANVPEFGTLATKPGYLALKEMDAYSHVVNGARYPAVLITGGINDHRVPVWMAAEMAARLRAATASGRPVRLRVDFEGGHHMMGAAKADEISQATDTYAFVLQHTGAAAFQPPSALARAN